MTATLTLPLQAPPPVLRMSHVAKVAFAITAAFLGAMFVPGLLGADMMQWGYAAATLCGFLAMCALVTAFVYVRRARELAKLFAGDNLLAAWTYEQAFWEQAVQSDTEAETAGKRRLLFLVIAFSVLIGGGFWILDPDAGRWVALVLAVVVGLCTIAAYAGPRWRRQRQLTEPPAAWIGRRGAYVGGLFHDWSMAGSALQGVETVEDDHGRKSLELTYRYVAGAALTP